MEDSQGDPGKMGLARLRPGLESASSLAGGYPVRTCVGCRTRAPHLALQRLVAVTEGASVRIVLDHHTRLPGRGVWLHARLDCVTTALHRKALQRSLHLAVTVNLNEVEFWRERLLASGCDVQVP